MIIDAHVHIHPEKDAYGARCDASLENLLDNLENSPVDKAILFAVDVDTPYIKSTSNDYVHQCCIAHPDKFIGFASVNPATHGDAEQRLETAVTTLHLKGLKLHPRFMGLAASDPRVIALARKAGTLGIPVAIDCYLWRPTPLEMQLPFHFDALCKAAPSTNIIMCHTGGFRFLDALAVAKANDNIFFDFSLSLPYFSGTPFEEQFLFVLKSIGPERLIYGSDHPQQPLAQCFETCQEILRRHQFSDDMLEQIFGGVISALTPGLH